MSSGHVGMMRTRKANADASKRASGTGRGTHLRPLGRPATAEPGARRSDENEERPSTSQGLSSRVRPGTGRALGTTTRGASRPTQQRPSTSMGFNKKSPGVSPVPGRRPSSSLGMERPSTDDDFMTQLKHDLGVDRLELDSGTDGDEPSPDRSQASSGLGTQVKRFKNMGLLDGGEAMQLEHELWDLHVKLGGLPDPNALMGTSNRPHFNFGGRPPPARKKFAPGARLRLKDLELDQMKWLLDEFDIQHSKEENVQPGAGKGRVEENGFVKVFEGVGMSEWQSHELFRKIDGTGNGKLAWDDAMTHLLHEEDMKASLDGQSHPYWLKSTPVVQSFSHLRGQIGCLAVCSRQHTYATMGRIQRAVEFWDASTCKKLAQVKVPGMHDLVPGSSAASFSRVQADRCLAYLSGRDGSLFCTVGTDPLIHRYNCRKFRHEGHMLVSEPASTLRIIKQPRGKQAGYLLVGDSRGHVLGMGLTALPNGMAEIYGKYKPHSEFVTQVAHWDVVGIISAGCDGKVAIGDEEVWRVKRELSEHTDRVDAVTFNRSRRIMFSAGADRVIKIWDPFMVQSTDCLRGHKAGVISLFMLEQQDLLMSVGADKAIKLWDLRVMKELQKFSDDHIHHPVDRLSAAAWDNENQRLLTAGSQVRIWRLETNERIVRMQQLEKRPVLDNLAVSKQLQQGQAGTSAQSKVLVDARFAWQQKKQGSQIALFPAPVVPSPAPQPNPATPRLKNLSPGDKSTPNTAATAASAAGPARHLEEEAVFLTEMAGGGEESPTKGSKLAEKMLHSPSMIDVAKAVKDVVRSQSVNVFEKLMDEANNLSTIQEVAETVGIGEAVVAVLFTKTFNQILLVGERYCTVVDLHSGQRACKLKIASRAMVTAATLDADQRRLITGAHDGSVSCWNFNNGQLLVAYPPRAAEVTSMLYLPNRLTTQRPLVVCGWDKLLTFFAPISTPEAAIPWLCTGHKADIMCMTAVGIQLIASGDADGTVRLWGAGNQQPKASFCLSQPSLEEQHYLDLAEQSRLDKIARLKAVKRRVVITAGQIVETTEGGDDDDEDTSTATPTGAHLEEDVEQEVAIGLQQQHSVFSMTYLATPQLLLIGSSSGKLYVARPLMQEVHHMFGIKLSDTGCCCMDSSPDDTVLVIGDNAGCLKLCHVTIDNSGRAPPEDYGGALRQRVCQDNGCGVPYIREVRQWQGHRLSLSCVSFLNLPIPCFASAAADGSTRLWSHEGAPIAVVGLPHDWPQALRMHATTASDDAESDPSRSTSQSDSTSDEDEDLPPADLALPSGTPPKAPGLQPPTQEKGKFRKKGSRSLTPGQRKAQGEPWADVAPKRKEMFPPEDYALTGVYITHPEQAKETQEAGVSDSRPFHERCPIEVPKALTEGPMLKLPPEIQLPDWSEYQDTVTNKRARKLGKALTKILEHAEKANSVEVRALMAALESRLSEMAMSKAHLLLNLEDLLPPVTHYEVEQQRLQAQIEIAELLAELRIPIRESFKFYCCMNPDLDGIFAMGLSEFKRFAKECRCNRSAISKVESCFLQALELQEVPGQFQQGDRPSFDSCLRLPQFALATVRLGVEQYGRAGGSLGYKVQQFLKKHVVPYAKRSVPDKFVEAIATVEVMNILRRHHAILRRWFDVVIQNREADDSHVSIVEFLQMLRQKELLDTGAVTQQKAVNIFLHSTLEDEEQVPGWVEWTGLMSYSAFQQALTRVADVKHGSPDTPLHAKLDTLVREMMYTKAGKPIPPQPLNLVTADRYEEDRDLFASRGLSSGASPSPAPHSRTRRGAAGGLQRKSSQSFERDD